MTKLYRSLLYLSFIFLLSSCGSDHKEQKANTKAKDKSEEETPKERLNFDHIIGIRYTEVRRRFSNGLSFDKIGFQQEPSWILEFQSNDTVKAYSPVKKRMLPFFLMYDHGDVYNFAKEYFRIKKATKDSLVFQRLQVDRKQIDNGVKSDVNMIFYADSYIKNILKTTPGELQKPNSADTVFIRMLAEKSNQAPTDTSKTFAGRQPAQFISTSPLMKVEKKSTVDEFSGRTVAFDYLFPKYRIEIKKAYQDFAYDIKVIVDAQGNIHLVSFYNSLPELEESRRKIVKSIIDIYLRNLLKIVPGTTLGIPHSSEINLVVVGKKAGK
ncbi:hypothetical protein [Pedobacter frigoris]|uniref:Lipoprotein n=1 Tax=Pedobacter frigoris TaxID=2571272 RepID=A0A4U1CF42_9SPHI|nr:hypothetical protein [Pedobacter frigoris]TKC04947.1 hypothetical protein FA047_14345 [Pedobacter frigoris]